MVVAARVAGIDKAVAVLIAVVAVAVFVGAVVPNLGDVGVRVDGRVGVVTLGVGGEPIAVLIEVVVASAVLVGAVVPGVRGRGVDVGGVDRLALRGRGDRIRAVHLGAVVEHAVGVDDVVAVIAEGAVAARVDRRVVGVPVLIEVVGAVTVRVDVVVVDILRVGVDVEGHELRHASYGGVRLRGGGRVVPAVCALHRGKADGVKAIAVLVKVGAARAIGVHAVVPNLGCAGEDVPAIGAIVAVAFREGHTVAVAVYRGPLRGTAHEEQRESEHRAANGGASGGSKRERAHPDIVPRIPPKREPKRTKATPKSPPARAGKSRPGGPRRAQPKASATTSRHDRSHGAARRPRQAAIPSIRSGPQ